MSEPGWLTVNADVVVITDHPGRAERTARRTTIRTVAAQSFTVTGFDCRFRLRDMRGRTGGDWGSTHQVAEPTSELAVRVLEAQRKRNLFNRAQLAVEKWTRSKSREDRLAAISALEIVEDES